MSDSSIAARSYADTAPLSVAFLGLGVMGYPMAGHLATAGHRVTVYNRTPAKARAWCEEFNGGHAATPREALAGADMTLAWEVRNFCAQGQTESEAESAVLN
jgi:glutamyl-tRNA reductase